MIRLFNRVTIKTVFRFSRDGKNGQFIQKKTYFHFRSNITFSIRTNGASKSSDNSKAIEYDIMVLPKNMVNTKLW